MNRDVTDEPWYANWDNVIALGRWLVYEHRYNGPQLLAYFSKSWNWSGEWHEYQELEKRHDADRVLERTAGDDAGQCADAG